MIDPRHVCFNTRHRQTDLKFNDGVLSGLGVGVRVLIHAFVGAELTWYYAVSEDGNDVDLLAVDPSWKPAVSIQSGSESSPIRQAVGDLGDLFAFSEAPLPDEANCFPETLIRYDLHLHDDCFFWVAPVDDDLLESLVHCVLRQHSYYLGRDIDWGDVLKGITDWVKRSHEVWLFSDPEKRRVRLTAYDRGRSWLGRLFHSKDVQVDVADSIARFTDQRS